jgi:hypothetical protein
LKFVQATIEVDTKENALSIQAPMPRLPTIARPGDQKAMRQLLENVKVSATAPNEIGNNLTLMNFIVPSTKGPFTFRQDFPLVGVFDTSGKGDTRVDVKINVEVQYMPPTSSDQVNLELLQNVPKAAAGMISSMLTQSSTNIPSTFNDLQPRGHGPLWLSDPSASTCSEIDLSDEFPPVVHH